MRVTDHEQVILSVCSRMIRSDDVLVVGISGYGGSGKSTLAREISEAIPGSVVIGVDQYYVKEQDILDDDWNAFD